MKLLTKGYTMVGCLDQLFLMIILFCKMKYNLFVVWASIEIAFPVLGWVSDCHFSLNTP